MGPSQVFVTVVNLSALDGHCQMAGPIGLLKGSIVPSDEPEAVDDETQRRISGEARRRWEVVKAEQVARKASRSRCDRLENVVLL